jgi:hypothetical protein
MPIDSIAGHRHGAEVRARQHQILMGVPPRGKDEARGGDQDERHRQNANRPAGHVVDHQTLARGGGGDQ